MSFQFLRLEISDVVMIKPDIFSDGRGFFAETYKYSEFAATGIVEQFVQDNHSKSKKGVMRGLHYQNPPGAQGKLVSVVIGEVFDVAVDIRRGSPTYGRWVGVILSEENSRMLYIPKGFAHGYITTSDVAHLIYKTTCEYDPECEAGIIWNDPEIKIEWPIERPTLSLKDSRLPRFREALNGFVYRSVI